MGTVEEKILTTGLVRASSAATLPEYMKLLKQMQDQHGSRKAINSELWHACAGPLVSLPQVGCIVYYFPQGHSEQVAASTKSCATSQIPNYPNLQSQLMCQVHNVSLHADKDTDEVYAQMNLQPVNSEKDIFPVPDFGLKPHKHPSEFFCKTLTASDTSTHGGFSVPRRAAEKLFPPLDYSVQPPMQELVVRDLHDNTWAFRHIYRGQPKRHLLTTGWSLFVGAKKLKAGDAVLFTRDERSQLMVGVKRANNQLTALPSSVLSADSMHIGVLAAAAHASANSSPFTIFYNPRACPSEFVIPLAKYRKSVYGTQVSVGTRFGMMFETEESGKRRFMGTVVGASDIDPLRWPNSKWRNLQVEWDECGCSDKPKRVSSWDIETPESLFIFPSLTSSLKRPLYSGCSRGDADPRTKRSFIRLPDNINGDFPRPPISSLYSEQIMKMLMKPQEVNCPSNVSSSLLGSTSSNGTQAYPCGISVLQNQNHFQSCQEQPNSKNTDSSSQKHQPDRLNTLNKSEDQISPEAQFSKEKTEPIMLDQLSQPSSQELCNEEKPFAKQNLISQFMFLDQKQVSLLWQTNPWLVSSLIDSSLFEPQQVDESQSASANTSGLPQYPHTDESISEFQLQDLSTVFPEPFTPNMSYPGEEFWDNQLNNNPTSFRQKDPLSSSNGLKDLSDESNNQSGIYSCLNFDASNGGSTVMDPSVSSTIMDGFGTLKEAEFKNVSDCLMGNFCSSQDVQSHNTSVSLADSQAFSRKDTRDCSGGVSSSKAEFDESTLLQSSSWKQVALPMRTYTKVQKAGSVGRSIDVTSFRNYDELSSAIECMFGLEGLLNTPRSSGWKLVYVDYENDVLLVGDDPWEEFVGCVRCIRILSPSEVQQMSEEGMQLLNSSNMPGMNNPMLEWGSPN